MNRWEHMAFGTLLTSGKTGRSLALASADMVGPGRLTEPQFMGGQRAGAGLAWC